MWTGQVFCRKEQCFLSSQLSKLSIGTIWNSPEPEFDSIRERIYFIHVTIGLFAITSRQCGVAIDSSMRSNKVLTILFEWGPDLKNMMLMMIKLGDRLLLGKQKNHAFKRTLIFNQSDHFCAILIIPTSDNFLSFPFQLHFQLYHSKIQI